MISEIITIGTEILIGSILNTNGPYLSRKLTDFGYDVFYHASVRDRYEDIRDAIETALTRSDLIFLCGGLGPTQDDMTKQALAHALNIDLYFDEEEWRNIRDIAMAHARTITDNNKRQAEFPKGAVVIPNDKGTAPGCKLNYGEKVFYLLPGPPREFEPMVDLIIDRYLEKTTGENFIESLRLVNIGESNCEDIFRKEKIENDIVQINTFAKTGEVEIKIMAHSEGEEDYEETKRAFDEAVEKVKSLFAYHIYGNGEKNLFETLVQYLASRNMTISFAESVTGGLLAHMITSVPGSADVIKESYITYSDQAKIALLDVSADTILDKGVVSSEVAAEMSRGLYARTKATFCISTTGEAGPDTTTDREAGTVCYSIRKNGREVDAEEKIFRGDRNTIQFRSAKNILATVLLQELGGEYGRE